MLLRFIQTDNKWKKDEDEQLRHCVMVTCICTMQTRCTEPWQVADHCTFSHSILGKRLCQHTQSEIVTRIMKTISLKCDVM